MCLVFIISAPSGSGKSTLVKRLKSHSGALEHLDWTRIVERVGREVLKRHREGEPVISLAEHEVEAQRPDRLAPAAYSFTCR